MSNVLSERRGHERTRVRARAIGRAALGGGSYAQAHFVRDGCHTAGLASWFGGHVWRRSRWWAFWTLALVLVLVPRLAFAVPFFEVERNWADIEGNDVYYGYIVVDCPSAYQASLLLIGEYSSLVQIDTETYNKLMSPSTGGKFYELVQEWGAIGPAEGNNQRIYPAWAGDVGFQVGLVNVYGYGRVWGAEVTDTLKASAREDFLAILGGESVGGGGSVGGGTVGDSFVIYGSDLHNPSSYYTYHGTFNGDSDYRTFEWTYNISDTVTNYINSNLSNYPYVYAYMPYSLGYFYAGYRYDMCIYMSDTEPVFSEVTTAGGATLDRISITGNTLSLSCRFYMNSYITETFNNASAALVSSNSNQSAFYYKELNFGEGGGEQEPDPEPDPDPQPTPGPDPIGPQPPDLPDPGDPVVPDPPETPGGGDTTTITNITITNVTNPTNTSPADYTPWLEAILNELKGIHNDLGVAFNELWSVLETHCLHLQEKMSECAEYVGDCVQDVSVTVSSGFSTLLDYLRTLFQGLMEYMEEQSQWIVDNLRFVNNVTVDQYDDTSVLYWLRRIYTRLGSGIVNTRPVDPVSEWDPWGEWLRLLVQRIIDMLTAGIGGAVTSAGGVLESLSHVFPFCIPFDLLLLVDAMTTTAVTPQISITLPETDWYDEYTIDIDCEPYDDAMEVVRSMELIAFVVYVMMHSSELFAWKPEDFYKWGA